jgi:hypothetical protein
VSGAIAFTGGTFNHNNGTLNFNGTTTATLTCNSVQFNLVTFSNTTGTKSVSTNCNLPLGNNPSATSGGTILLTNNGTLSGTGTLTTGGTLTLNGSGTMLSGFTGLALNNLTVGPTASQTYNVAADLNGYSSVAVAGSLLVNTPTNGFSTTLTAPSGTMTVSTNFTVNSGATFNHNNGTVDLGTAGQLISGSNTFYNLTKNVTTAVSLRFAVGTTQTVLGTLTLTGAMTFQDQGGSILTIRGSGTGTVWNINAANQVLSGLSVVDSNNVSTTPIRCESCIDAGNNTNWSFGNLSVSFALNYPFGAEHITLAAPRYRWTKAALANKDIYSNELGTGTDNSFPATVRLSSGELLVAFRSGSAHVSSDGKIMLSRSSDNGVTWSTSVIYDDPSIDDRLSLGMTLLANGTILIPFVTLEGTDFEAFIYKSVDNGHNWEVISVPDPTDLSASIVADIIPYGQLIELPDGTLYMPAYSNNEKSFLLQSTNGGTTWSFKSYILDSGGGIFLNETSVLRLSATDYLAVGRGTSNQIYQMNSTDGGNTWTGPTTLFDGVSPNLLKLQNGDVLLCVGDRTGVQGVRCHLSANNGASWSSGTLIFNRYSAGNIGYPATIQFPNGNLFATYYHQSASATLSNTTSIGSTHFEARDHQITTALKTYYSRITKYELYAEQADGTNALHIDNIPSYGDTDQATYSLDDEGDYLTLTPKNYTLNLGENRWRLIGYDNEGNRSEQSTTFWAVPAPVAETTTTATSTESNASGGGITTSACTATNPGKGPQFISVTESPDAVQLNFESGKFPLTNYRLQYRHFEAEYISRYRNIIAKNMTSETVTGLESNTSYAFRIRSENGCAVGVWSKEIRATTQTQASPTPSPSPLTTSGTDNASPETATKKSEPTPTWINGLRATLSTLVILSILWFVFGKRRKTKASTRQR